MRLNGALVATDRWHRLYLVAFGTTWRLWWAPSAAAARLQVRSWIESLGFAPGRVKLRRARPADLEEVAEWKRRR